MKKFTLHIILICILFLTGIEAFAQYTLDNNGGKLNNTGTIRVKSGQVRALPDTLGGRMEFLQPRAASQQGIPNIVYKQLVLGNTSTKVILDDKDSNNNIKHLIVLDSLIISDSAYVTTKWATLTPKDVIARSTVSNTAKFKGDKDLIMQNEQVPQTILGNGSYSKLKIDNPNGVTVKGGGFQVEASLTLNRGLLNNDSANNFTMLDSSKIIRNVGGSIATTPVIEKNIDLHYGGVGDISSGAEIPKEPSAVNNMIVNNAGTLKLNSHVTVNDSLFVYEYLDTGNDTLTLATTKNPVFESSNTDAQIGGTIELTKLRSDSTRMYLHNPYTYAIFKNDDVRNGITRLVVSIKPRTFPALFGGNTKVKRSINIDGFDDFGNNVKSGMSMLFGYGWRELANADTLDESNQLPTASIILQRYDNNAWSDVVSSVVSQNLPLLGWSFGSATEVNQFGSFALGVSGGLLTLNAKVLLEGPYRYGSMSMDLFQKGYLTMPPPDMYPYNLDPNRAFYVAGQLPDSVVDWVVVEFRPSFTEKGRFRTYLVKTNGDLVDIHGNKDLILSYGTDSNRIDSGNYYIAIRHRTHLAVITKDFVGLLPGIKRELDFSTPDYLMGGNTSLKAIDKRTDNTLIYGMIAGDVQSSYFDEGIIDASDFNSIIAPVNTWTDSIFQGYLLGDIDMNGIITTRDYNMTFNNRGRVSALPK